MAAQAGKNVLLKMLSGSVYTTIAGLRTNSFDINNETIDVTNKDSAGWRELLAGGSITSCSLSADGVFKDAAIDETLRAAAFANTHTSYELHFGSGDKIGGTFAITSYNRAGSYNGEETFSLSLESSGLITYTASV